MLQIVPMRGRFCGLFFLKLTTPNEEESHTSDEIKLK